MARSGRRSASSCPRAPGLLNRPQRLPRCGQTSGERVAQVVEIDLMHSSRTTCRLEALCDLGAIERRAGLRVGEHEIAVAVVLRALRPTVKLAGETVGHRHGPACGEVGLAVGRMLASHERLANTNALSRPVHIPPAQPEQLRLSQAGHRSSQDHHSQDRTEHIRRGWRCGAAPASATRRWLAGDNFVEDGPQHGVKLIECEELKIWVGVPLTATTGP